MKSTIWTLFVIIVFTPLISQALEPAGARIQGMGGAGVALPEDATTVWYNPAGLYFNNRIAVDATLGFSDIGLPALWGISYLKYEQANLRGAGFGVYRLTSPFQPDADAVATLLSTVYLTPIGIPVGVTFKYINEKWPDEERKHYFTGDVGAFVPWGKFLVGLNLQNVTNPGSQIIPSRINLGVSYRLGQMITGSLQGSFVSWDEVEDFDQAEYRLGAEFRPSSGIAIQAGRVQNAYDDYWTGGLGLFTNGGLAGLSAAYHWFPSGNSDDRFYVSYRYLLK
ncbi:hypothetical protein KKA08_02965 [bacterium]|nr:hypothetical protein [bacterium]